MLKKLSKKYELAIISNSPKEIVDTSLKNTHLQEFFKVIVTASDVKRIKPDKEPFELAIKKLKVKRNEVVYIGDMIYDYLGAKSAKIDFIAFVNGYGRVCDFNGLDEKYKVKDILEVVKILEEF